MKNPDKMSERELRNEVKGLRVENELSRNCKLAVVLAQEWIAEKDERIAELEALDRQNNSDMLDKMARIAELEAEMKVWKPDTSSLGHACPACGRAYDLALKREDDDK